jgi:hypothetical protein
MDTFSKHETSVMKGVAILFMLFLHLFNNTCHAGLTPLLYINKESFVYIFSVCTYPVEFFLLFSGYGLYISYRNGKYNNVKRNIKLYINYWLTLLVFVPIGAYVIGTHRYPGNIQDFLLNITGLHTTYNTETWFIFPYMLLSLTSPILFKIFDKFKVYIVIIFVVVLNLGISFIIHLYGPYVYTHYYLEQIILYFNLMASFTFGMELAKNLQFNEIKALIKSKKSFHVILPVLLCVIMLFMILVRNHHPFLFQPFYAPAFTIVFLLMNRPAWLDKFLNEMGKKSTIMWLVHSYFCYHIFSNFIYGFKYPLVIYFVLLLCSYLVAVVLGSIYNRFIKLLGI